MRTKVTLVLLFLNVALFFFIFYLRPQWATEERLKEARRHVLGPESVNIQSLEIATSGRTVRLVKRGEAWSLTQPFDWPANPFAVNRILTTLQNLQHETSFAVADLAKNGQSLADYGLEKPSLTVTFTTGLAQAGATGPELPRTTLRLGDTTKDGSRIYVLSPDRTRVHVVDRSFAESLALPAEQVRSDALFTIQVFEVRSFNLLTAAPANLRIRLRHDGNSWAFETPIVARASKAAAELAINRLYNLRVHSFLDATPPPELSPATNRTLSLTLEGNNRRETLILGGAVAPAAPAPGQPAPTAAEYYGQIEGKSAFFTVAIPTDLVNVLRNAQTELRERRVLDFDARAVTAITLRAPNSTELVLQRLETTAGTGDVTAWQIVRRDGAQAPLTQPADAEAVKRLLEKLSQLSAQEFLTEAPTSADLENWGFNNPQREVALALAGSPSPAIPAPATALPSRRSASLKIGVGAERGPSANAFDGDHYYRVDAEILRELPVEVTAWRDRRLRELPAGERITSLKLTDIASKAVLFEKDLAPATAAPAGTATTADAALKPLLEQLRALRAKAFRTDRFTPTVTIDGAERPWKYQLDVTVALVGGAGTQSKIYTLLLSDRIGGGTQIAGAQDLDAVFEIEQPLLDALWKLTYSPQDPGPAAATPTPQPAPPTPPASSAQPPSPSAGPTPSAQPAPAAAQPAPAAQPTPPAIPGKANP